ncbi:MAG: type II toxin-antitoxin system VapC family toxin [Erysipelotrichaceae bacterium]|nr:type II toxin-antitoxin system VapC family toxin [Erysipelotrichaceae bacterium]
MRYMLDTNICIFLIRKKSDRVLQKLMEHDPEEICISSITYAELVHGVEKSKAIEKNRVLLTQLLSNIEVLDFGTKAADEYGNIRADLEIKGYPIGPLDTMIAAHAKSLGYILVTNNTREFNRVEGITVEDWATE